MFIPVKPPTPEAPSATRRVRNQEQTSNKIKGITIDLEVSGLDKTLEKANKLKVLLKEVKSILDSLPDRRIIQEFENKNPFVAKSFNALRKERRLEPISWDEMDMRCVIPERQRDMNHSANAEEKLKWFEAIGAIDISKYTFLLCTKNRDMLFSEEYLKNNSLEELKMNLTRERTSDCIWIKKD